MKKPPGGAAFLLQSELASGGGLCGRRRCGACARDQLHPRVFHAGCITLGHRIRQSLEVGILQQLLRRRGG